MDNQNITSKYINYICRSHEMARDLSRYVICSVNIKSKGQNFTWTHCEWFKFNMPAEYLYTWLKEVEPELAGLDFKLIVRLNDNSSITVSKISNVSTLQSLCASHIMEIDCVNENYGSGS